MQKDALEELSGIIQMLEIAKDRLIEHDKSEVIRLLKIAKRELVRCEVLVCVCGE